MARQAVPTEFRTFDQGFFTEHNYLDCPPNSTLEEWNFEVDARGVRRRRLGLGYEVGSLAGKTSDLYKSTSSPMVTTYLWEGVGGIPDLTFLVVQYNNIIHIYSISGSSISDNRITGSEGISIVSESTHRKHFDYASVDGQLVITTGKQEIAILAAKGLNVISDLSNVTIETTYQRLLIRDTFGVSVQYELPTEPGKQVSLSDPRYRNIRPLPGEGKVVDYETRMSVTNVSYTEPFTPPAGQNLSPVPEYLMSDNTQFTGVTSVFSPRNFMDRPNTQIRLFKSGGSHYLRIGITGLVQSEITIKDITGTTPGTSYKLKKQENGFFEGKIPELEYNYFLAFIKQGAVSTRTRKTKVQKCSTYWQERGGYWRKECWWIDGEESYKVWSNNIGYTLRVDNVLPIPGELSYELRAHYYNLRNQTWGEKRFAKVGTQKEDPILSFYGDTGFSEYPANTDSIFNAYYPNPDDVDNKTSNRFHGQDLYGNPAGNMPAPKGYFIIDALNRSESRLEQWKELAHREGYKFTNEGKEEWEYEDDEGNDIVFNPDTTSGGATAVAEYAGRLWYGGFSGDGSLNETRLESFLLFSQLTNSRSGYWRCYQEGDPTSYENPDVVATDGGIVPLDGAYGIQRLINLGNALVVFAANGVWMVTGTDGNLFSPTSQRVYKLTDKASVSPRSLVQVDNNIYFWATDGIYQIVIDPSGAGAQLANITYTTIHSHYTAISSKAQENVVGSFDPYTGYVTWLFNNTINRDDETEMLLFKPSTGAFFRNIIKDGDVDRTVLSPVITKPYIIGQVIEDVYVGTEIVVSEGQGVIVETLEGLIDRPVTTKYLVIENGDNGYIDMYFAEFNQEQFEDWGEVDADAHMVTSYYTGGENQRGKNIDYLTCHFERTEDLFTYIEEENPETGELDKVVQHETPSSCIARTQWDWANTADSNRWSKPFQAYRLQKAFIPESANDTTGTGFATTVTKNKVRGNGLALAMEFNSSPSADCRLLGYGIIHSMKNKV
jgi:hypothetical protein